MTTTDHARTAWNDRLKRMRDDCGQSDPHKAGVEAELELAEALARARYAERQLAQFGVSRP